MKIWLLTHSEERKKASGTGPLVQSNLQDECEIIEWSRVEPSPKILDLPIDNTVLIYPNEMEGNEGAVSLSSFSNIIILDGTWQQARKMYNRSPYLHAFQHYEIKGVSSVYSKRRNQKSIGLCTAEVAIYALEQHKHPVKERLLSHFLAFNQ